MFRSRRSLFLSLFFAVVSLASSSGFAAAPVARPGAHSDAHFYMVMFGAQGHPNLARLSHTFATFVKVEAGAITEEQTISWLPAAGYFGRDNSMPPLATVPGHNYTLDQTIAMSPGRQLSYSGPFEITSEFYDRASAQVQFLNRGTTSYKMFVLNEGLRLPANAHQDGGVINCIMAVSDVGAYVDTGTAWGFAASRQVLMSFSPYIRSWTMRPEVASMMGLPERITPR